MAGEDRDDIASQLSYCPIFLGLRKIWLSEFYWKIQPRNGKDSGDDGSILNTYCVSVFMLVREIFNAFEDSFQFTKTHWWREERGPSLGLPLRYLQEPLHPPSSHSPHHSTAGSGCCSGRPSSGSAPEGSLPFQLRLKCHSDTSAWKREKQQWPFLTLQQLVMKMTKVPTRTDVYTWCSISSPLSHVFMWTFSVLGCGWLFSLYED